MDSAEGDITCGAKELDWLLLTDRSKTCTISLWLDRENLI